MRALLALALWLPACGAAVEVPAPRCPLTIITPDVPAMPGAPVTIRLSPSTSRWDTSIALDGVSCTVTAVERTGCEACDNCRVEAECSECSDCDACDALCAETCAEIATFVVPVSLGGAVPLTVSNAFGSNSEHEVLVARLSIAPPADDTADTGIK